MNSCCGCLRPPLGGMFGLGALDDLEQGLLHALARHVAGDGRGIALARHLVDLVDVDDAARGGVDVVVGVLEQLDQDVLHVLAHVARLGQRGGVGNGERHLEHPGQGLGQERLASARGADEQDVGLVDLHVLRTRIGRGVENALVMVVHGHGQDLLGLLLADDVLVQQRLDLLRRQQAAILEFLADGLLGP